MGLSKELIQQFVDVTNDIQDRNSETFVLATAVVSDGKTYVKIDGSEILTPVKSTTKLNEGDRVTVMIKNHTATVTGNITSPSVDSGEVENKIDEFGTIIAKDITAQNGKIDNLISENVTIKNTLTAVNADIENLVAENVEITGKLEANEAEINKIKVGKLDADTAEITYATIESLKATNIEVNNIKGEFADFSQLTAEDLKALNASIKNLDVEKLNVKDAEIKFANIDFSNIGMAAIEELFAQSGIIKDLVTESGTITGELVGVTIKGDLIEAETLVADKLVVKGQDGLYYKLNVSGNTVESEQTEYNSLNGSIITAKSITATKISVSDLVAFDATIGGFKITDTSIYSGVKESATNGTRGVYLDSTGQLSVGDANNFIKFFKDTDGKWKLAISANTIKLSASNSDLESTIDDIKNKVQNTTKSIEEQFAASDNPTTVPTTGWSTTPPVWQNGKYIWSKTVTTYTDGRTVESKPVCITGAKGENGSSGKGIKSITNYYLATNVNTGVTDATSGWTETVQTITASKKYLWNYEKVTYTDDSSTKTTPVIIGVYGDKGQTGSSGLNGQDGVGIKSISEKYAVSSSNTTAPSTWYDTVQTMTATNKYLWNYEIVTYTNNTASETSKRVIGAYGDKGATGATGATGKGIKSVTNYYLATNVNSGVTDATSGWTTTIQSLTSTNKYLWNYELITYTDNSTTKTTPLVIGVYGDKGQNGATGATGNGIKNITEKYAVSTSNTTAPTTWFNEVQVMTATNKYLWNYEIITYTNGGTSETSKRVIGVYGDKGATGATGATGPAGAAGVGIKSVDVEYYLSTSSTSQAGGSWTTTAPTWVDGKYIWTRTKTITTDNKTTTTSPVCITGGKGGTGSVGQGVQSITEEYYLSTSKTTQTGGSWVTTPPTWSTGKYMWTRSKIVYKNPTSTAYTKPVCDSSWEAVNEIEVGGTNIALETNQGITGWGWGLSSGKATLTEAIENGIRCCKMVRDSTAVSSWSYISYSADRISREKYLPNKQYTVSFEVKASVVTGFNVILQTEGYLYPFSDVARTKNTVANSWVKLYATITTKSTLPTNTGQVLYFSGMNSSPGVSYIFRNLKIEEGNKPTAWTPAPEDLDSKINTTNETVATIESNLNKITLRVSDTETKTATLEKKTEKMLINNFSRSGTKDGWSSNIGTIIASNSVGYYANVSTNGNAQVTSEKFEIDVNKSYKMSLMVQNPSENATGSWFFGVYAYDKDNNNIGVYLGTGTSLDTNAYFHHEQKANKNTNWRTFEAYIYSHNTVVNANTPKGNCLTFMKFNPRTKYLVVRFLNYRSAPYGNGQTGSIYFAHPTISVVDNIIVDTEKRLKSAESKITSDAIVDTVKKHQTNGKNTFALTSQVTQTVDSWVAKFTSGGGYNLLKNSDAKNGQYMWTGNGVTLTIGTSGANPFFGGNEFKSTFPNGLKYSESIKLKANTDYVYEGWIYCDVSFKGSGVSPLHYWCMNTPNTSGQAQLEVLDYRQDITKNVFNKCYVHFRTKSGDVYFTPFVYGGPKGEMVAVRQLSLTEGKVETAWTPHPSEIYEGSTVIDASGVTVKNGALRVTNNSGQTVISANSEGNLWVQNRLVVGNSADGRIEVQNESGAAIVNISKHGVSVKNGCMGITTGSVTTGGTGYPEGETRDTTFYAYGMHISEVDYVGSGTAKRIAKYQGGDTTLLADNTGNAGGISYRAFLTPRYVNLQKSGGGDLNFYDTILMDGDSGDIACNTLIVKSNGMCNNILAGDDAYIGDVNIQHSIGVQSSSDRRKGIIYLGNRMDVFVGCDHENGRLNMSARWMDFNAPDGTNFFANVKTHDHGPAGVTGFESYRNGGHFRISPNSSDRGGIAFEQFYSNGSAHSMKMIMEDWYLRPNGNNGGILGTTGVRWQEVWCTRGAFNGSDSKLKENITPLMSKKRKDSKAGSSLSIEDVYEYVKNADCYTFNYKKCAETSIGILADDIPDPIFGVVGVWSKTEEQYQEELAKQEFFKEELRKFELKVDSRMVADADEETEQSPPLNDTIVEGTEYTYGELKELSEAEIEPPVRLINGPAQIALLQSALSTAINKNEELTSKLSSQNDRLSKLETIIESFNLRSK